VLETTSTRT